MTPAQLAGMAQAVSSVANSGVPVEAEDLRQQAWVVALETAPNCNNDSTAAAYIARAVGRQLGNFVSRSVSLVHLPHGQLKHAHRYAYRAGLDGVDMTDGRSPEADLADAEVARRFQAEVARLLGRMRPARADMAAAQLGIFTDEALLARDVANDLGVSVHAARRARREFIARARRSPVIRDVWQLLVGGAH